MANLTEKIIVGVISGLIVAYIVKASVKPKQGNVDADTNSP